MTEKPIKLIAKNPNAYSKFLVEQKMEAGMVLTGTEVKSLREQSPNLRDAFVEVFASKTQTPQAFLVNAHIPPYSHGNLANHEPLRKRKLLLHDHELKRIFGAVTKKGYVVIPVEVYFKGGIVKVLIGLGKGKKKHDRRESEKKKDSDREMSAAVKKSRRS